MQDPETGKVVQSYIPNDRLLLLAIDTTKGVLDRIIKLRREMSSEKAGLPRWMIEKIERGLRNFPDAQEALLKELATEDEPPKD